MSTATEQTSSWQLDEEGARTYERFLVPALMDPWAADLVDAVDLREGQRVLDVACGTGIVARHAAPRVAPDGAVTGVDVNPAMLAIAAEVSAGRLPTVSWDRSDAHALPYADRSFDVVLCQQGLQFLADPGEALREMSRVATDGARLGVSTCGSIERQPGYRILRDTVSRHLGVEAAQIIASPYALGDADELRHLVTQAGFGDVRLRRAITTFRTPSAGSFLHGETASSPLGDIVDTVDDEVVDGLIGELEGALRPHTDDEGVVFPFETLVVTATA